MRRQMLSILALLGTITSAAVSSATQHTAMPAGMAHEEHMKQMERDAAMKKRGTEAMGFDQDRTRHHFWLSRDGGMIEVNIDDVRDGANRKAIRKHLKDIAREFSAGVFERPWATHAEIPPGVPTMQRLQVSISYNYEDTRDGGRVRIRTSSVDALSAIHDFLRYQITEHATGDPLTVSRQQ